jgi:AAA family ATP:ADP antiporter
LLVVSAGLLACAVVCVVLLGRWARTHGSRRFDPGQEAAVGGGMFDGLKQVFGNPFMRAMAFLLLLGDGIGTINYALVADYSGATFTDAVARTRFAANLDLSTNILQVIVQLTLTRWLLVRHGAAPAIAVGVSEAMMLMVVLSGSVRADRRRCRGSLALWSAAAWPTDARPGARACSRRCRAACAGAERGRHRGGGSATW